MVEQSNIVHESIDRGMEEIEDLYAHMFMSGQDTNGTRRDIHPEVKSKLHKKILSEIESLRELQRSKEFGSREYREIDCKIRNRVLKEIQIIIDAHVIARGENRLQEWESMYGDIEHYKRDFFYFRMDQDYETSHKMLDDYKFIDN